MGGQGLLEGLRTLKHGLGALKKQRVFCRQPRAAGRAYERLGCVGVAHGRIGVGAVRAGKPHSLQGRQAHAAREGGNVRANRGICRQSLLAEKVVAAGNVRDRAHAALVFARQRRCGQPLEEGAGEEEGRAAQPVDPAAHNLCLWMLCSIGHHLVDVVAGDARHVACDDDGAIRARMRRQHRTCRVNRPKTEVAYVEICHLAGGVVGGGLVVDDKLNAKAGCISGRIGTRTRARAVAEFTLHVARDACGLLAD